MRAFIFGVVNKSNALCRYRFRFMKQIRLYLRGPSCASGAFLEAGDTEESEMEKDAALLEFIFLSGGKTHE